MGTLFLTFLGTSRYDPIRYTLGGRSFPATPYIQETIARAHKDWLDSEDGNVKVFMTAEARKANWDIEGGLKERLGSLLSTGRVQGIEMRAPTGEESLWDLFEILEAEIPPGSEIILDITHGFRTLPLIGTVLTGYTRALKQTKVSAIYYATTDADSDGQSEVIDLTRLDRLMRWSGAIDIYLRQGNPQEIERLTSETVHGLVQRGYRAETEKLEKTLASNLKDIYSALTTVRGKEIVTGKAFLRARSNLETLCRTNSGTKPMVPLLQFAKDRLSGFLEDSPANLLFAVDLCIQYELVQQGLTLLQESIVTILLAMEGYDDFSEKNLRLAVSRSLSYLVKKTAGGKVYDDPRQDPSLDTAAAEAVMANPLAEQLAPLFDVLSSRRNNINHASFNRDDFKAGLFRKTLREAFSEVVFRILEYDKPLVDIRYKNAARMISERYPFPGGKREE